MNNSQKDTDLYNIDNYTDTELYELLDLNSPTDRELEAKIIFFINKYETINNDKTNTIVSQNAKKMTDFFEAIYRRFFETEEDEEEAGIEGFTAGGIQNALNSQTDICFNAIQSYGTSLQSTKDNSALSNTIGSQLASQTDPKSAVTNNAVIAEQNIGYTRNFEYSKSYSNPLLKETITRIISIDSQFRDQSTYSYSTDYTFNLSDTLQDVVSLKLYSIQIPYNWWTINKSFGSNFFYIKGNSPGIIGYDYQIAIHSGTYAEPTDLITAIQFAIANVKSTYTDVSFGTTGITISKYGPDSLANIVIDITNLYNETYYYLDWGYWTNPNNSSNRLNSIPGFLGFNYQGNNQEYIPNSIYSISIANSTLNDTDLFTIDSSNNYFNIYLYNGTNNISYNNSSQILFTIPIILGLANGTYTRPQILTAVNTTLQSTIATDPAISNNPIYTGTILSTTLSNLSLVPDPTSPSSRSLYKLTIQINRFANPYCSVSNMKMAIEFPHETSNPVWVQNNNAQNNIGCFYFQSTINELNNIVSESQSLITNYQITDSPYIVFKCTKPDYNIGANDITVTLANGNYTLNQYIAALNTAFKNTTYISTSSVTNQTTNSNIEFDITINKRFDQTMYKIDLTNCYLHTDMHYNTFYSAADLSINSVLDSSFSFQSGGYNITSANNTFYVFPDSNQGNQASPGYEVRIPVPTGTNYADSYSLQLAINSAFTNTLPTIPSITAYDDSGGTFIFGTQTQSNHLANSTITIKTDTDTAYLDCTLNFTVNNTLTQADFSANFFDPSANGIWLNTNWYTDFALLYPSYDLGITNNTTTNIATITGDKAVRSNEITINSTNKTFYFRARPNIDGISTSTGETDISFTIPIGTYTKEQLFTIMNTSFMNNPITTGTVISTISIGENTSYTQIHFNINKVYTAEDYSLVFYDIYSFVYCNVGVTGTSSKRNITKDSTLGWILGFRSGTIYDLSDPATIDSRYPDNIPTPANSAFTGTIYNGKIATLTGDTTVNTNLYNYFLLVLNDYTQNHLNDGLVTLITKDTSIPLPSYAERSTYVCDPVTGKLTIPSSITNTNNSGNSLTQKQLYSANSILQNQQNETNLFSNGPFIQDVFAVIPMKVNGYSLGQVFVEYGGTLQQQERTYFGPVNIHRMSVQLITDRGDVLDLNGANWSFGLVCQQLYHPPKS